MNLEKNQTVVIHPTEPDGIGGFSYLALHKKFLCKLVLNSNLW